MNYRDLPQQVKTTIDNETPFKVIKMGEHEIRQYWTKKGVYGSQVITILWGPYNEKTESCLIGYDKTGGYGYCKESAGFDAALLLIGKKPKGMTPGSEGINHKYHVGGNFYQVPVKDLRKYQ